MKIFLVVAPALLLAAAPLEAQSQEETPTMRVSYADLDLSRPYDRLRLDRRLREASRIVCRMPHAPGPYSWIAENRCERATLTDARQIAATIASAERRPVTEAVVIASRR